MVPFIVLSEITMEHCFRVLLALVLFSCLRMIRSAPIKVSFDSCKPGAALRIGACCCPLNHQRPIVDFELVQNSSRPVRIRRALQCLDQEELAVYKEKLIHFWNWDNDGAPGADQTKTGCFKAGNTFPAVYADPSSPLFHSNRSWRALVPSIPVDLAADYTVTATTPQLADDIVLSRNRQVLHDTMVVDSCSARVFFGREYRAGDPQAETVESLFDGIGSLELRLHASVHFWVGEDMGSTLTAARDPIFYAHHGNVERLWDVWRRLGPGRADPSDPDFLDAEFLFFDENVDLVRVKVMDVLDQRALGYDYEQTNGASWNYGAEISRAKDSSTSEHFGSLFSSKSQALRN